MTTQTSNIVQWAWKILFVFSSSIAAYTFSNFANKLDSVHNFMLSYPVKTDSAINQLIRDHEQLKKEIDLLRAETKTLYYEQSNK